MVMGEIAMKPVSIMILADAGAAGRDLLVRRDVELGWALTLPEIQAAMERRRPRIVLVRAEFAADLMSRCADLLERVPVIVMVAPSDWSRRESYFDVGATALVSRDSKARILEAVSELTGLPTRYAPRVPYPEVVDVGLLGSRIYLEATELGTSGISIRDFPPARVGEQVEVTLVMMEPALTLSGMVVRSHIGRMGPVSEIAFNALNERERTILEAFVTQESARCASFPEPVGLTSDLMSSTFTLDLFQAMGSGSGLEQWLGLLRKRQHSDSEVRAPKWLVCVERELSELERWVVVGRKCPAFVHAALEMRLDLARAQASVVGDSSLTESCELALDFCRTLATDAASSSRSELAYVPEIRAGILSQIYGWTKISDENTGTHAA